MTMPAAQTGFTLVEVLVALAIASVALLACMRALAVGASGTEAMHQRSLALLAAENVLAELRLSRSFPPAGRSSRECRQGPLKFTCEQTVRNTANANFRQVTIRVQGAGGPVLAELSGLLSTLP